MSTTARKARKKAGIPFVRTTKTGTPIEKRLGNQPHSHIIKRGNMSIPVFSRTAAAERRLKNWSEATGKALKASTLAGVAA